MAPAAIHAGFATHDPHLPALLRFLQKPPHDAPEAAAHLLPSLDNPAGCALWASVFFGIFEPAGPGRLCLADGAVDGGQQPSEIAVWLYDCCKRIGESFAGLAGLQRVAKDGTRPDGELLFVFGREKAWERVDALAERLAPSGTGPHRQAHQALVRTLAPRYLAAAAPVLDAHGTLWLSGGDWTNQPTWRAMALLTHHDLDDLPRGSGQVHALRVNASSAWLVAHLRVAFEPKSGWNSTGKGFVAPGPAPPGATSNALSEWRRALHRHTEHDHAQLSRFQAVARNWRKAARLIAAQADPMTTTRTPASLPALPFPTGRTVAAGEGLGGVLTTGGSAAWTDGGREYAHAWLDYARRLPSPSRPDAREHLEQRLAAAESLQAAFEAARWPAALLGVVPAALAAAAGWACRRAATNNGQPGWKGSLSAAGALLAAEAAVAHGHSRARAVPTGLTGYALAPAVAAALPGLVPHRRKARAATAAAAAVAAGTVAMTAYGSRHWSVRSIAGLTDPDGDDRFDRHFTAGSDVLLNSFENATVTFGTGLPIPLPVALAIHPGAIIDLYPDDDALRALAHDVVDAEWRTYHRPYAALGILLAPWRHMTRNPGADYLLMHHLEDGVAIRVLAPAPDQPPA